jgi:hypothetical protein
MGLQKALFTFRSAHRRKLRATMQSSTTYFEQREKIWIRKLEGIFFLKKRKHEGKTA